MRRLFLRAIRAARGGGRPALLSNAPAPFSGGDIALMPSARTVRPLVIPARIQALLRLGAWLCLPFVLFGCFFHWSVLDPGNVHWLLQGDWGQHVLGWHAFQHSHAPDAFNHHRLLAYPSGVSLLYTDSNPLVALVLKPFSAYLPADFQYIGPWLLLCVLLQVAVARQLLRRHLGDTWTALAGAALLSLLPTFYHRMGHDTLMAHWLILAALWIYFECPVSRRRLAWAGLLGLCGLIHPYLLFMAAVIWAADVAQDFTRLPKAPGWRPLCVIVFGHAAVLTAPIVALAVAGAFTGNSAGEDGFGTFSMGLDAPINPFWPQASTIFKAHPVDPGQAAEGFQYLGAGVLFLIGAALVVWWRERPRLPVLTRARGLIAAALLLLILALSSRIQIFGVLLLRFSVPDPLKPVFSILRASGRLFWPVAYLMVFLALRILAASRYRWAPLLIPAALVLQAIDLMDLTTFERQRTENALDRRIYVLTRDPHWQTLVARARQVDIYPPNAHVNDRLFYEIAWRSASAGIPVSTMYTARQDPRQTTIEDAARRNFQAGHIAADHLYILISRCNAPASLQSRVRVLDGVFIIPPQTVSGQVGTPVAPWLYHPGDTLSYGWNDAGACTTRDGFAMADADSSKATAANSRIELDLTAPLAMPARLDLTLGGNKHIGPVDISVNASPAGTVSLPPRGSRTYQLPVPAAAAGARHLTIAFAVTPDATGRRNDLHDFFRIRSLAVTPLPGPITNLGRK